ncbi:MAG: AIR synthase-related protein [Eubacterium sp.]|nr:AIR synthase-related protein [Eubacterium sp.]
MKPGKVKESIWKRSVLRQIHTESADSFLTPDNNAGAFPVEKNGDKLWISSGIMTIQGWTLCAKRAVYGAVNALAAAGAEPRSMEISILMPEETEERQLKELVREMDILCEKQDMCLRVGYAAAMPHIEDLIVSVYPMGLRRKEAMNAEAVSPDMAVVVAGSIGREGAAMIAREREKELLGRYPSFFIKEAAALFEDGAMKNAADILRQNGALFIHHPGEGGIFAGFWELAVACKAGLDIDLKRIPIRQHTIEVCEYFNLNPYMLRSEGCLLAVCEDGTGAVARLEEAGFRAAVAGHLTDSNDRIIRYDDEIRFLEPPKPDEYYKMQ